MTELAGPATIVKANVENNAQMVADFRIIGLRPLLLFVNGKEVFRENFAASREGIRDWIFKAIGFQETLRGAE